MTRLPALFAFVFALLAIGSGRTAQAIGFIDSPNAYCRQVKGDRCVINWGYLAVDASPNYMVDLWVFLGDRLVHHTSGFFQTSMYVDNSFFGEGFFVKCGTAGTTPVSNPPSWPLSYGNSYPYTIRARDSAGLSSANFGTVVCPPK